MTITEKGHHTVRWLRLTGRQVWALQPLKSYFYCCILTQCPGLSAVFKL